MAKPRRTSTTMAMHMVNQSVTSLQNEKEPQIADKVIQEELKVMPIFEIPISEIYSAPTQWNQWNKLPEEKMVQLCQSIIDIGQQAPCILWKVDKKYIEYMYDNNNDDYNFTGDKYMILSGHNRAFARQLIGNTDTYSNDERYKTVPAFVYEDKLSDDFIEKAQQIIDDTNFLSREKTTKEIMAAIVRKQKQFNNGKRRQNENVAEVIAESLNMKKRQVFKYSKINQNLLKNIQEMMFEQQISLNDALELADYPLEIQRYLYEKHKHILLNKRELKKFLKTVSKDMTINEIDEVLNTKENQYSFEKITVSVPCEYIEDFNIMFKEWKKSIMAK